MKRIWRHYTASGAHAGEMGAAPSLSARVTGAWAEILDSRQMLLVFTMSRFRAKFRAQALGIVWPIANPFILMIVMSVVFGVIFKTDVEAYPVFLMLGLVLWQFVTHAWTDGTTCLVTHADVVKKTAAPGWVVAVGAVAANLFTLGFAALSILPLITFYPEAFKITWSLLTLPIWIGFVVIAMSGMVLATSVLHVFYRDVGYIVDSTLLVLFWMTPIIWPLEHVTEAAHPFILANPIAACLTGIRVAVMEGAVAPAWIWGIAAAGSFGCFAVGLFIHVRRGNLVADHV